MTDDIQILISATLDFRLAAGTPESKKALDELIDAIPGAKTIRMGYAGRSRIVQMPQDQVETLRASVRPNYEIELAREMSNKL